MLLQKQAEKFAAFICTSSVEVVASRGGAGNVGVSSSARAVIDRKSRVLRNARKENFHGVSLRGHARKVQMWRVKLFSSLLTLEYQMRWTRQELTQRQKLHALCFLLVVLNLLMLLVLEVSMVYRFNLIDESSQQPSNKYINQKPNKPRINYKAERPPASIRPTFKETKERYQAASATTNYHASRLKLLALAAIQFSLDHDDRLAFRNQNFHQKLLVYGGAIKENRLEKLYVNNQKKYPYSFNDHIIGVNREKLTKDKSEMAWTTVMFYKGRNGKLDFVHRGYALVCFVPGQVWLINRQEAKSLGWEVPAKFKH